jgi:uncharacterized protein YdaU (DUF1376 family)
VTEDSKHEDTYARVTARLEERRAIELRLAQFYTQGEIKKWLRQRRPQLGNETAIDMINRGHADRVHAIIDRLR